MAETLTEILGSMSRDDVAAFGGRLKKLGRDVLHGRAEVARLEAKLKKAREAQDELEGLAMTLMDQLGQSSLVLSSATLSISSQSYFRLPPRDDLATRNVVVKWLRRAGAREMFDLQIPAASLAAFCRERMGDGRKLHPGIVVDTKRYLSVRRKNVKPSKNGSSN